MYTYPWVFGYYNPAVYDRFGWYTPSWYGQTYYPWSDWYDAPYVYYYYRYPGRFWFGYGNDYDVGYTYVGGAGSLMVNLDRPLGVWVPGHWEPVSVVDTEWVWVPGYYIY